MIVERDHELDALRGWFADADACRGRVVVVSGEAGIGKTALLTELREACGQADWLECQCDSQFTPRPFGPLFDVADRLGDDLERSLRRGDDRQQVFASLLDRLGNRRSTTVFVVEDIQWADEATLDLVRYAGRRITDERVLIVLTCRDDASADDTIRLVIGDLARLDATRRIELGPLTLDGVAAMCATTSVDAREIHELSGGNPFFAGELIGAAGRATPTIVDAVRSRLIGLDADTLAALELAAVAGMRVSPSALRDTDRMSTATERLLVDRGILAIDEYGSSFRHDITRRTVLDRVPPRQRRELHQRLLDGLVATGSDDDALLAHHAERAGDRDATLRYATRAASVARRVGSARDAVIQLERALSASDRDDLATTARLHDELADAFGLLHDLERSLDARAVAVETWTRLDDPARRADSLARGAWVACALGRVDVAFDDARSALDLLEPLGPSRELAAAHATLARLFGLVNRADAALAEVDTGRALADELGLDDLRAEFGNIGACCRALRGEPWVDEMRRTVDIARSIPTSRWSAVPSTTGTACWSTTANSTPPTRSTPWRSTTRHCTISTPM
ncbi:MAG: AAA family ATPase [Ilumatobacter sp.]|nr:AAA family ATPase [Ilumatobacter sp.]